MSDARPFIAILRGVTGDRRNPVWRHDDGSIAEW
jgi:hypothetical protein